MPGFGGFDGQVILEYRALPIGDAFDAVGVEPVGPPLLALFMEKIVVLEIFRLEVLHAGNKGRGSDGKDHDVG